MDKSVKERLHKEDFIEFKCVEGHGGKQSWRVGSCLRKLAAHLPRLESHTKGSDSVVLSL